MDDLAYTAHLPDLAAALDMASIGESVPIDPSALADDIHLTRADPDTLLAGMTLAQQGPAAAVPNLEDEELLAAGLPRDLPGGLAPCSPSLAAGSSSPR